MFEEQLFMVRAELDQVALLRFAERTHLSLRTLDDSYVVHAALKALFGESAPKPFITQRGRGHRLTLLAYAGHDHRDLADRALALADPLAVATLDLASMCSKPMPSRWRTGAIYRFETRVCPVVRISGRARGEDPREVDAFIHRCLQVGADIRLNREAIYREWLERELGRDGAARTLDAQLARFQLQRLWRRAHAANEAHLRRCQRPDVTFRGVLEVEAPGAFLALIRRGLGRHRAFGFGMLLLRN